MAVKAEKQPVKAEEPKKKEAKKDSFFLYLGPNISGVIQKGSIFPGPREEVEKLLAPAIARYPRIKALLVSDETLVADRIEVTKPGTRLNAEFNRLVDELK